MAYGAKESSSKEGMGLMLLVFGIIAVAADWAYADGIIQVLFMLLGIVAFVAGFGVLRMAKSAG